jgi:hypothetical protein
MLVSTGHDKPVEPSICELLAQALETVRARKPLEVLSCKTVMVTGRHRRPHCFEPVSKPRRDRVGDEDMPACPDLGRRREHTLNESSKAFRVVGRPRFLQQTRELVSIRSGLL